MLQEAMAQRAEHEPASLDPEREERRAKLRELRERLIAGTKATAAA